MNKMCIYERDVHEYSDESFRKICTASTTAKSTFFYLMEIGRARSLTSHQIKNENLNTFFFAIMLNGKATLTYKEHSFNLSRGSCLLIDCMEPHIYESDKNYPSDIIWIHFNGLAAKEYYKIFETTYVNAVKPKNIKELENIDWRIADRKSVG